MRIALSYLWSLALVVPLPCQAVPSWHLELVSRVRPSEGSPGMLGHVSDIAVRSDGGVYIAERSPGRVTLFNAHGEYVRVMMRDGAGPGETQDPEIVARGDTLICYTPALHRLAWISGSGKLIRETPVNVDLDHQRIRTAVDGSVFIPSIGNTLKGYDGSAVRVKANGTVEIIRWSHSLVEDLQQLWRGPNWVISRRGPFSPPGVQTFDPQGHLVIGGSRQSRWFVIDGRDTLKTVSFTDTRIPIRPTVRDSAFAAWFKKLPKFPDIDKVITKDRMPVSLPPWVSFDIGPDGRWWIGRSGPNGQLGSWDVAFGGRIIGHAVVPAPLLEIRFVGSLTSFGSEFVAMVHESPDGSEWVGVYRVVTH